MSWPQKQIAQCLDDYRIDGALGGMVDREELAAEIESAIFPEDEFECEPIWYAMLSEFGICTNCGCTDCGCCRGCGGINADVESGHGYWCAL